MSDGGVLLTLWIAASVAMVACCLRALHHLRKAREIINRAVKASDDMRRVGGEVPR